MLYLAIAVGTIIFILGISYLIFLIVGNCPDKMKGEQTSDGSTSLDPGGWSSSSSDTSSGDSSDSGSGAGVAGGDW
jgi:hypothetical protein